MKRFFSITLIASAILISGCSKKEEKSPHNIGLPNTEERSKAASSSSLPRADKSTPESEYRQIEDPIQLTILATALSSLPIDYEKLAQAISDDYRRSNDNFKKQDIITALKPKIDAMIADARAHRYFIYKVNANLKPYDFNTKSFGTGLDSESIWSISNYTSSSMLQFTNGDDFTNLAVNNEQTARNIEGLRSSYQLQGNYVIYAYAQDKDLNRGQLKAEIVTMKLVDKNGSTLTATNK